MRLSRRHRLVLSLPLLLAVALPSVTSASRPTWTDVSISPPEETQLLGVSATSSAHAWAVGYSSTQATTLRWNGRKWKSVDASGNTLNAVDGTANADMWAVGQNRSATGPSPSVALHWDGTTWMRTSTPSGGTARFQVDELTDVVALAPDDVWAVGATYDARTGPEHVYVLRWDGTRWRRMFVPQIGYSVRVTGIAALSDADVWIIGSSWATPGPYTRPRFLAMHWDGAHWNDTPLPSVPAGYRLSSIAATSGSDVWAVGADSEKVMSTTIRSLIFHWNGVTWRRVASPNRGTGNNELNAVAALSTTEAWAVGWASGEGTLIERWNGTAWKLVASPNGGSSYSGDKLSDVDFSSPTDGWAVGSFDDGRRPLLLHCC